MTQFEASDDMIAAPPRTSVLAVVSLVMSLICCIPGVSAIGALFGVGAIFGISKSEGRVRGMGLAVAGVVVGLIITLIWIIILTMVASALKNMSGYDQMIVAIETNDRTALSSWITNESAITDEQYTTFRNALQTNHGGFISTPDSIMGLMKAYAQLGQGVQSAQATAQGQGYFNPIPIPAEFDNGLALLIIAADSSQLAPNNLPSAENIAFVASDGSLVWLIDPAGGP